MLLLSGEDSVESATKRAESAIESGAAFETMQKLTAMQGGDPKVIEDTGLLPQATSEHLLTAPRSGFVSRCDAYAIGVAAVRLGAGRATKEDDIDPAVGFIVEAKVGDRVDTGDPLLRIAYNDESKLQSALEILDKAWEISYETVPSNDLVLRVIR
jgi:thymidine phosphorylase